MEVCNAILVCSYNFCAARPQNIEFISPNKFAPRLLYHGPYSDGRDVTAATWRFIGRSGSEERGRESRVANGCAKSLVRLVEATTSRWHATIVTLPAFEGNARL